MNEKPKITTVITDLDNTLFDWVEIWFSGFNALLETLISLSGVPKQTLTSEIRKIHQRHRTSEYAFLIQEIPSLQKLHPGENLIEIYDEAIHEYRKARKDKLLLYPGVKEALKRIKDKGALLVGYTESMEFYTNYRVRNMGLDGVLDFLYSPKDHDLPKNLTPEQIRMYPADYYKLKKTIHKNTPPNELKPNPAVLLDIIEDINSSPENTLYVGDSMMKDIVMAKEAGVYDVLAAYGKAQHKEEYKLLREVSHWPDHEVEKEKNFIVKPTFVLKNSMEQLFDCFNFCNHGGENGQGR